MYRVTAHLENVQKVDAVMGRKKNDKVSEWRAKYTIAKGKNGQKMHKYGKELINISFVN